MRARSACASATSCIPPKFSDEGRVWEGDVVQVSGPRDSLPFNSAQELSKILSSQAV